MKIETMKHLLRLVIILFFLGPSGKLEAQTKNDVIVLVSGEKKEGKVTGINESHVKFRYPGEEFDYEFAKGEIAQIEFASGRVEKFGQVSAPAGGSPASPAVQKASPASSPDRHNKIAVLPFDFISNDPGISPESMRTLTQSTTANFVRDEYRTLTLQDPMTTNAILGKNNINHQNVASFTPDELVAILGVEYVIYGTVNVTNKGASTYGSAGTTYKEKDNNSYENNKSSSNTKGSAYTASNSTTTINYDTTVDFRMFNDRGDNLYSQSRHVFGTTVDAYKGGIEYMVKRTPFGSKYGKN
jgi:TolB-like protein